MRQAFYILLALICGCVFSYVPVAALCSIPGLRFSNACGHNAVYWFIVTLPVGFVLAAILALRLYGKRR